MDKIKQQTYKSNFIVAFTIALTASTVMLQVMQSTSIYDGYLKIELM